MHHLIFNPLHESMKYEGVKSTCLETVVNFGISLCVHPAKFSLHPARRYTSPFSSSPFWCPDCGENCYAHETDSYTTDPLSNKCICYMPAHRGQVDVGIVDQK